MKKHIQFLSLVCLFVGFISCSDDDDGGTPTTPEPQENQLTVDGEEFPLKLCSLGRSFENFFGVYFATSAYDETTDTFEDETFNVVHFEIMVDDTDQLQPGTYNFRDFIVPGSFSDGSSFLLNSNANLQEEEEFELIAGSLSIINITDTTIEARFEVTASSYAEGEREVELSGYYKGNYLPE